MLRYISCLRSISSCLFWTHFDLSVFSMITSMLLENRLNQPSCTCLSTLLASNKSTTSLEPPMVPFQTPRPPPLKHICTTDFPIMETIVRQPWMWHHSFSSSPLWRRKTRQPPPHLLPSPPPPHQVFRSLSPFFFLFPSHLSHCLPLVLSVISLLSYLIFFYDEYP